MTRKIKELGPALTTREAAKVLSVHGHTMRNLIHRGAVRSFKVGNDYRIMPAELQRFIAGAGR